jgi:hypothetical protein
MLDKTLACERRRKPGMETVLPHEWVFGAFLLLTAAILLAHQAARLWSLVYLGLLLAAMCMVIWTESEPTPRRWRIRLGSYFVAMGIAFYAMGIAIPLTFTQRVDGMLLRWDRALLGETPAVTMEPLLRPWLEDLSMAGYLFFFYYLLAGPFHYARDDLPAFRSCIVGLFTIYGIAFMGYLAFPAAGPHLAMTFHTPLHGDWLVSSTLGLVNRGSNSVDVFPSVHVAASLYLLLFDSKHWPRRFWWVLAPCALLWFSTLYLRFHYFVDLLAGVVVSLVGLWVERKFNASGQAAAASRNTLAS